MWGVEKYSVLVIGINLESFFLKGKNFFLIVLSLEKVWCLLLLREWFSKK